MVDHLGPRRIRLLTAWQEVAQNEREGPSYDLTRPTRSERFQHHFADFISEPSEESFGSLWQSTHLHTAKEWYAETILNLWPESIEDLAKFFDDIRTADQYNPEWETEITGGGAAAQEVYSRHNVNEGIVSMRARRGLQKFGVDPGSSFDDTRSALQNFSEVYKKYSGHVTGDADEPIPIFEEIDELLHLVTAVNEETIRVEAQGPRGALYNSLRGYPAPETGDRGPIDINFDTATPPIDGHVAARRNNAYKDTTTEHWAGTHYEWWKWDFAEYVSQTVSADYDLTSLSAQDVPGFLDAFWANSNEYTDTAILSTPVPQYLLGSWGVRQFADFEQHCLDHPDEAAVVLSNLFDTQEHVVDRLRKFRSFGSEPEISNGNLLRVATTFLMGAYPEEHVNFQYERFNTFFQDCSSLDELEKGFDARQYYRIMLACRDIRDAIRTELDGANMLDVHTLIRLYQDYKKNVQ